jgi:hypothetical protein
MGWTDPADWAVGESPTAAKINANLRDNMNWLHDSIPSVSVVANSAQTIADNTWTKVNFDAELVDIEAMHDTSTNNTRLTLVTTGVYLVVGIAPFDAVAFNKALGVRILLNNTTYLGQMLIASCNEDGNGATTAAMVSQTAGDYFELEVFQRSGGNLDTIPGVGGVSLMATRL